MWWREGGGAEKGEWERGGREAFWEGMDSQVVGGSHGSSTFNFSNNDVKFVSTAIFLKIFGFLHCLLLHC